MGAILAIPILLYILCWVHMIFRLMTGGKDGYAGPYCCDPRATFDEISSMGVALGTGILILILIVVSLFNKLFN